MCLLKPSSAAKFKSWFRLDQSDFCTSFDSKFDTPPIHKTDHSSLYKKRLDSLSVVVKRSPAANVCKDSVIRYRRNRSMSFLIFINYISIIRCISKTCFYMIYFFY